MNESSSKFPREITPLLAIVSVAACCFAALWLSERFRKPPEIIREIIKPMEVVKTVPVERIKEVPVVKEVPKEVIKEVSVPARLTEPQQEALAFYSNYVAAATVSDMDDALFKIDSLSVRVNLKDELRRVVSEDLLKGRCEQVLRRHGIRFDEDSPYVLGLHLDGFWQEPSNTLIFGASLVLFDSVTMVHRGDFRHTFAIIWVNNFLGAAERDAARQVILSNVETNSEVFCRKFLAAQERSR